MKHYCENGFRKFIEEDNIVAVGEVNGYDVRWWFSKNYAKCFRTSASIKSFDLKLEQTMFLIFLEKNHLVGLMIQFKATHSELKGFHPANVHSLKLFNPTSR